MRVVCVGETGSDLSAGTLEKSGNTKYSKFNVTIGREYTVYAMSLKISGLSLLVVDDTGRPNWRHIELFNVVENSLPSHWEFVTIPIHENQRVLSLWGYPTLIRDLRHRGDLIDRKYSALAAFVRECEHVACGDLDNQKMDALKLLVEERGNRTATQA